ncbi:50S ribosomal protein L17 [bacterium]|nr:50S ribosomal protein L17 [bacterium]
MRHKVRTRTLGRQTGHRIAMLRNMATSLLREEQIETTVTRAKEVARFTENILSWARKAVAIEDSFKGEADSEEYRQNRADALACKRRVFRHISDHEVGLDIFNVLARRYAERHNGNKCGGYVRVIHNGFRKGDGAPMAIVKLVK